MGEAFVVGIFGLLTAGAAGAFTLFGQRNDRKAMQELIEAYKSLDDLPPDLRSDLRKNLSAGLRRQAARVGPTPTQRLKSMWIVLYLVGCACLGMAWMSFLMLGSGWRASVEQFVVPFLAGVGVVALIFSFVARSAANTGRRPRWWPLRPRDQKQPEEEMYEQQTPDGRKAVERTDPDTHP